MRLNYIIPLFAIFIGLSSCKSKENKTLVSSSSEAIPLNVLELKEQEVTTHQEFIASFEGQENIEIRPKISGFIQKLYIQEGEVVKKGQLLFQLETETFNQDAAAAAANVQAAQVEVDKLIPLVERNIISNVQLETAKSRLVQAQSTLNSVKANIAYANIVSPTNGVVGSLPYKKGSLVSPSNIAPLTTVSNNKSIIAIFTMNEKQLLQFNKAYQGNTISEKIKNMPNVGLELIDNSLYPIEGKVQTINGLINPQTGTVECRAIFSNPDALLRSGGSGTILLPTKIEKAYLIPQIAVFEMQGKYICYVLDENNIAKTKVLEIEGESGLNYIVTSGITDGEIIVVEGVSKIKEGQEIAPVNINVEKNTVSSTDSIK